MAVVYGVSSTTCAVDPAQTLGDFHSLAMGYSAKGAAVGVACTVLWKLLLQGSARWTSHHVAAAAAAATACSSVQQATGHWKLLGCRGRGKTSSTKACPRSHLEVHLPVILLPLLPLLLLPSARLLLRRAFAPPPCAAGFWKVLASPEPSEAAAAGFALPVSCLMLLLLLLLLL